MSFYDLIIFDCDGTLVDSEEMNNRALADLFSGYGLLQYDYDYVTAHFLGSYISKIKTQVEQETGRSLPGSFLDDFVQSIFRLMPDYLHPVPGVHGLVQSALKNTSICVASNGERANVIAQLEAVGLGEFFPEERVFTVEMVEHGKPAPDLFLLAAERMGAEPSRTLVIEDSKFGTAAGVAAGMSVFGFSGTAHDKRQRETELQKAGAKRVFDHLIHIEKLLTA